jgi:hypothetical protein
MAVPYKRKQIALRRILLDGKGRLNQDARVIVADLRAFCQADGRPVLKYSPISGSVDPVATAAAVARREVYDRFRRMLNLDDYTEINLRDDDDA